MTALLRYLMAALWVLSVTATIILLAPFYFVLNLSRWNRR
jgi:hypothetical protein